MLTDHNSMDLKSSCFCNIMSIIQIAYNSNSSGADTGCHSNCFMNEMRCLIYVNPLLRPKIHDILLIKDPEMISSVNSTSSIKIS